MAARITIKATLRSTRILTFWREMIKIISLYKSTREGSARIELSFVVSGETAVESSKAIEALLTRCDASDAVIEQHLAVAVVYALDEAVAFPASDCVARLVTQVN